MGVVAMADGLMDVISFVYQYSLTFIVHNMHTAPSTEEVLGGENSSEQYRERRLKSRRSGESYGSRPQLPRVRSQEGL